MLWKDLFEAPLADFDALGDLETPGSLRADDLRAMRNPKWREKVYRAFQNTPYDFNVYVYNAPDAMAAIDRNQDEPIKVNDLANLNKYVGIQPLRVIARLIGRMPPNAENSITVLLVENEGDARVALTPWILAHRVVHAMFYAAQTDPVRGMQRGQDIRVSSAVQNIFKTHNTMFNDIENMIGRSTYHGPKINVQATPNERGNEIAKLIATFRSGKLGKFSNPGEFVVEIVTQYLVKGKVTFQRPTLDDTGRTPPLDPTIDADLLDIARQYRAYYPDSDSTRFVRDALAARYRIKNPPRKPDVNRESYTAFDQDGQAIAAFGPDRVEKYRQQGYRVERNPPPSRQAIAHYNTYVRRVSELEAMYDDWQSKGLLTISQPTTNDLLHSKLDRYESQFDKHIAALLEACVGKAVIL